MGKKFRIVFLSIGGLLLGVLSWAFYRIIFQGSSDMLEKYGVESVYAQNGLVILIVIVLVILIFGTSHGSRKIIRKLT